MRHIFQSALTKRIKATYIYHSLQFRFLIPALSHEYQAMQFFFFNFSLKKKGQESNFIEKFRTQHIENEQKIVCNIFSTVSY